MKKPREVISSISQRLSLPQQVTAALPQIIADGFTQVCIDLQKGLLSYSREKISVKVALGIVWVEGLDLEICLMREQRIVITGEISAIRLEKRA